MTELIIIRGGGDLATGTIHRLWRAGFRVLVLETAAPSAIRRQVSLCEAVYDGKTQVEGLTAELVRNVSELDTVWKNGNVPVLVDPECSCLKELRPMALVDAILAKKNIGTRRTMAPLTIALGPGFEAGRDVDVVIETVRGHNLGRVITEGSAMADTGIPGVICGYGKERVIHAPDAGVVHPVCSIGDIVAAEETIAWLETGEGRKAVTASISGVLRGMIRSGYPVHRGMKIADIDPRTEELENCWKISEKSRCIAGSVLEQICSAYWKRQAAEKPDV